MNFLWDSSDRVSSKAAALSLRHPRRGFAGGVKLSHIGSPLSGSGRLPRSCCTLPRRSRHRVTAATNRIRHQPVAGRARVSQYGWLAASLCSSSQGVTGCVTGQSPASRPIPTDDSRATGRYPSTFGPLNPLLRARSAITSMFSMPERPSRRPLPLPGAYSGECLKCGGSVPKVVRSGLAAYLCEKCFELRANGPERRLEDE